MLAAFMRDQSGTANQMIGRIINAVSAWDRAGSLVLSPRGAELVLCPPLEELDGFVHTKSRQPVFHELPEFKLLDPPMSFHADGKRTLNNFMQKSDGAITNALDIRLLSVAFWIGAYKVIHSFYDDL